MKLHATTESYELATPLITARGTRTVAEVVVVEVEHDGHVGRGEGMPHFHFGESVEQALAQLNQFELANTHLMKPDAILGALPAGAARNALDCALWEWRAKAQGKGVAEILGLEAPTPIQSVQSISVNDPEIMAAQAAQHASKKFLKLKAKGDGLDTERIAAVRSAAPNAQITIDANESWTRAIYEELLPVYVDAKVALIEQPFPQGRDGILAKLDRPIPIVADESFRTHADFDLIDGKYDGINIKLDKTGGLTEAMYCVDEADERGYKIMLGCMVATSLSMAPLFVLAPFADEIDADGASYLKQDRPHGMTLDSTGKLPVPSKELWGLV